MSQLIAAGLEVTLFGLSGVFAVLILFYLATKGMLLTLRKKSADKEDR